MTVQEKLDETDATLSTLRMFAGWKLSRKAPKRVRARLIWAIKAARADSQRYRRLLMQESALKEMTELPHIEQFIMEDRSL